jgi:hypothetical protein
MPFGRATAIAGTAFAASVLAAGTATALNHDRAESGIKGRVVPCGIVLERSAPCADPRTTTSVAIHHGDRMIRTVKVHRDGSFRAPLKPGSYWLRARTAKTRGPRAPATVPNGHWITVTLIAGRSAPPARR